MGNWKIDQVRLGWKRHVHKLVISTSRYVSVLQNMDYFVMVAKDLLNQRKEHGFKGSKDLVQLMLKAHEEHTDGVSKLSDSEITAQSVTFLVAGFETTGNPS